MGVDDILNSNTRYRSELERIEQQRNSPPANRTVRAPGEGNQVLLSVNREDAEFLLMVTQTVLLAYIAAKV